MGDGQMDVRCHEPAAAAAAGMSSPKTYSFPSTTAAEAAMRVVHM